MKKLNNHITLWLAVSVLMIACPGSVSAGIVPDRDETPPIAFAIEHKRNDAVKQLLTNGANPNVFRIDYSGSFRAIVDSEAQVHNMEAVHTTTLFILEVETKNLKMVRLLLDYKSDVNARGFLWREHWLPQGKGIIDDICTGGTALHAAAYMGDRSVAAALIQHGAGLEYQDYNGDTPIMVAAALQDARMVSLLLRSGASINARDFDGKSVRDRALFMGKTRRSDSIITIINKAEGKRAAGAANNEEQQR